MAYHENRAGVNPAPEAWRGAGWSTYTTGDSEHLQNMTVSFTAAE